MTDRQTRLDERRAAILAAARTSADSSGWSAVTTRRLAEAIGYSQPVLYGHFPGGKAEIMRTVALDGFADLRQRCQAAIETAIETAGAEAGPDSRGVVEALAHAYLDFADAHPAVYEAMFAEPIGARFAEADNEPELRDAFTVLAEVIGEDTATEVFWGALHGMSLLERAGRMKTADRARRVADLSARFA
ncbi:TetR/AcrR family transcriptional regulator [Brevibacterium casei]|uniref:Transcriptional regulator protein n=1 Tax=Brevibacterium casei S18 TaxID=1229781 RepID=K9AU14_9MICO|nr:TetR/AcrR family transcriptional regulator [Brevibacterium casei]EKU46102.1 transcriptional regulator protein [Brevibacterium casei S18]MCT1764689.1 TetR/AcrR family transcriptional regulator [Brevibacterium casei]QZE25843.1 TetR/AcrR family transcriptional regulator [Brevibacterium casei]